MVEVADGACLWAKSRRSGRAESEMPLRAPGEMYGRRSGVSLQLGEHKLGSHRWKDGVHSLMP